MSRGIEFNYLCKHTYQGIESFYSKTLSLDEIEKSTDIIEDIGNAIDISCNCLNESCNHCECNTIFDFGEFEIVAKRQFTGLLDCNGVKIFEGDIAKAPCGHFGAVMFSGASFYVEDYDSGDYYQGKNPDSWDWSRFEVIGNIHQNSELLK